MSYNQSIIKAFEILKVFTKEEPQKSLTQISRETGINKTTAYRFLSSLMKIGFVGQDTVNGYYHLGLKLFEMGNRVIINKSLINISRPVLSKIVKEVNITIHLAAIDDNEVLYLDKIKSTQSLQMHTHIGLRVPLHCTALGKSILSFLPESRVREMLKNTTLTPRTPHTIRKVKDLIQNLRDSRQAGYAVDYEEFEEGVLCVAVPILNDENYPIAAISMSGNKLQINETSIPKLTNRLKHAAQLIAEKISLEH